MTQRMSFGIQNDLIRYVPRGPQQTRSGVNWKSGGCGPIFQQNTMNVTYEAPKTFWDTTAGQITGWTGAISGGLGFLARGMQTLGLTKFPFVQRFVQSFGNQSMTYPSYGMGGYTNPLGMGTYSPFSFGGGCTNTYGMLNTGMQPTSTAANPSEAQMLKGIYSQYNVMPKGDGKYILSKGDGTSMEGTFDELVKKSQGETSQGAGTSSTTSSPSTSSSTNTPAATGNGTATQAGDGNSTPATTTNTGNGNGPTPATNAGDDTPQGVSSASVRKSGNKGSGKVHVPGGWYRADTQHAEGKSLKLNQCKSATEAMKKILSGKMDYLSGADREALTKELAHNNPSVFNKDGTVKANADWDKLDVPSIKYIKQKYVKSSSYDSDNGKVTYSSRNGGTYTNASTSRGAGGQTIRGKNGYYATFSKGVAHYYDPNGNEVNGEKVFQLKCPHIYASVQKHIKK